MRSPSIGSPGAGSSSRSAVADGRPLRARRRRNFRQSPALRVRSAPGALRFVDAVGFCSTFYRFPEGAPCLWEAVAGRANPRWPRRSHHDAGIGVTWELKDTLPARRQVYYGKLVKGRLSLTAKRIMDSLARESPQYTRGLRAECFMLEPAKTREFERAMAELQQGLWIVKTEERYEPTFSYRWDLVERWLPDAVAGGRRLGRPAALDRLLARYLEGAVSSTPGLLRRLFAIPRGEIDASLARLERRGAVRTSVEVAGWPGHWVLAT